MPHSKTTFPKGFLSLPILISIILTLGILYFFYTNTFIDSKVSYLYWMTFHWEQDQMDYGWMVPVLSAIMIYHHRQKMREAVKEIDWRGLGLVTFGVLIYLIGYRAIQNRIILLALPVILLGSTWFLSGRTVAKLCAFPLLFLWMDIPLIPLTKITIDLQVIATEAAHVLSDLLGVDTIVQGTNIFSTTGKWDAYSVTGGCSGMRSLIALILIAVAWAYVTSMPSWKKILFVACSVPMAVIGNIFRLTSIFTLSEYVNSSFASKTWHDWSGLLFFFPISLAGLALTQALLTGNLPWSNRRATRHTVINHNTPTHP
ncbi:MAG: exosortase/archaeosortase family protein [Akkermansia sp.]